MASSTQPYTQPPKHVNVLIIGGGPAGTYAASALAREGIEVAVFEASKFPRYHIGESLIPSVRHYLRFIGAEEKLANHGFCRKPGSAIKFNQNKQEGYTDFVALGHNNNAWNVVRSEFDQMLMNHARSSGAAVYERTKVNGIEFSKSNPGRPTSVSWTHTPPPAPLSPPTSPQTKFKKLESNGDASEETSQVVEGVTTFDYMIDATGRAGIMSTKYLQNRRFNESLKNVAVWGYWQNVGTYGVGTKREGAPWFEALTDETGWAWFIPLHNGTTSVGIVMNQKSHTDRTKQQVATGDGSSTMTSRYLENILLAPGLVDLIGEGKMVDGSVKSASDFSYSAPKYAGERYRIVGDAGAFIDPFFSSGIHLAMTSALAASASICASIRKDCTELEAAEWHTKRVATSYTRFQVVVLSAYKQMRAQNFDVLSEIDEDNYDRAFAYLRPVIQGASEMGARLSENELQRSLDFCLQLFNPTSPEQHERVFKQGGALARQLMDLSQPVMDTSLLLQQIKPLCRRRESQDASEDSDSDVELVVKKINARRVVHPEYAINNLETEPLEGFAVRLERGRLGLIGKH
ncbi:hypothetical protein CCMSSC00406_0003742 [Pleurotus cornucopiae]|uniref:Uncharacterized protein n=1 Tax=Pleurotus cornucopiae TaxID=5321 RepID=A0ACB7IQX4_PLECO|nr:hypothetical protein CCMSSC00406_0003742 [Pleurotus cornucopiae]